MRELLRSGEFPPGAQFLSERQVAERFQVSRITANKVLASLVGERLLEFRKGVGTFVAPVTYDYNLRSLVSFTAMVEAQGGKPETKVICLKMVNHVPVELGEERGERFVYVERLRLANKMPVILERRWFRAKYCPRVTKTDLKGSIYELWAKKYFLDIAGAEQTIRAVNLEAGDARLLGMKTGAAGLVNTSTGFLQGRIPLWFERTIYRGDAYEFFNRLGHIEKPQPAMGRLIG
jgi:GntR family transcriptional regulator